MHRPSLEGTLGLAWRRALESLALVTWRLDPPIPSPMSFLQDMFMFCLCMFMHVAPKNYHQLIKSWKKPNHFCCKISYYLPAGENIMASIHPCPMLVEILSGHRNKFSRSCAAA
jgi:hypothetical protein